MFEEICLVCGKHLEDDGRAYCSDECQNLEMTSPSISSSSSVYSSPHLGYSNGDDVPALVPSALGTALNEYRHHNRHSISSSSASSTSWSVVTDDEGDDGGLGVRSENDPDMSDPIEDDSKSNFMLSMRPSPLSYARRPSGTNHTSTVPMLYTRSSSGSSTTSQVRGAPRSAPNRSFSSVEDVEFYNSDSASPVEAHEPESSHQPAEQEQLHFKNLTITAKEKRTRNRASLPAYFSLLQASSLKEQPSSPMSSSSGRTLARLSPPTPKIKLSSLSSLHTQSSISPVVTIESTPRGRRREAGASRSSKRSGHSNSPSRSRSRHATRLPKLHLESRVRPEGGNGSVEEVVDWPSTPALPRGRAPVRRNSSPPPLMLVSAGFGDHRGPAFSFGLGSAGPKSRGRARVEELDGPGISTHAPGYGSGRSGLKSRERGNREFGRGR